MKILPYKQFIVTREWFGSQGGKHQQGYYKINGKRIKGYYHRYWPAYTYKLIELIIS